MSCSRNEQYLIIHLEATELSDALDIVVPQFSDLRYYSVLRKYIGIETGNIAGDSDLERWASVDLHQLLTGRGLLLLVIS